MSRIVKATLTRCRDQKPLVVIDSEPFNGLEIRPADLLLMAEQLVAIANKAASLDAGAKNFRPVVFVPNT